MSCVNLCGGSVNSQSCPRASPPRTERASRCRPGRSFQKGLVARPPPPNGSYGPGCEGKIPALLFTAEVGKNLGCSCDLCTAAAQHACPNAGDSFLSRVAKPSESGETGSCKKVLKYFDSFSHCFC